MLNKVINYLRDITLPPYIPRNWGGVLSWFDKNISGLGPLRAAAGIKEQDFKLYGDTYRIVLGNSKAIELCDTLLEELKRQRLDILAGNLEEVRSFDITELSDCLIKINGPVCGLVERAKVFRDQVDAMPGRSESDLDACGYLVRAKTAADPGSVQPNVSKHFNGNLVSFNCTIPAPGKMLDISCDYHDGKGDVHVMTTAYAKLTDPRPAPEDRDETRRYTLRLLNKHNTPIGLIVIVTMIVRQGMKF